MVSFFNFIMFYIVLISLCFSTPTSDLTPPFYPNEKNRVGYWDVGGASLVYEDNIILLPPIQNHKGSVWDSLPIPFGEWFIDFYLDISSFNKEIKKENKIGSYGGFAIWLINSYGADGTLLGGPNRFQGTCISSYIANDNSGSPLFQFGLFQSNGTDTFTSENFTKNSKVTFKPEEMEFKLRMHIQPKFISLVTFSGASEKVLINNSLKVDLSQAWLGVTSMTGELMAQIDLLSAKFHVFHESLLKRNLNGQQQLHKQNPHVHQSLSAVLRNPSFSLMKKEISDYKKAKGEILNSDTKIEYVLTVCDEIGDVVSQTATYGQLNDFIRNTMIPYTQGWQKRTFKIIDGVDKAKSLLTQAFNQTKAMIEIFNNSMLEMTKKTDKKIVKLSDLLNNETHEQGLQDKENIKEYLKQPFWINLLRIISVCEVVLVFIFYIRQRRIEQE